MDLWSIEASYTPVTEGHTQRDTHRGPDARFWPGGDAGPSEPQDVQPSCSMGDSLHQLVQDLHTHLNPETNKELESSSGAVQTHVCAWDPASAPFYWHRRRPAYP